MTITEQTDFEQYVERWNDARRTREQQRRDPTSYVSYSSFHKLDSKARRFDAIPGVWSVGPDGPRVELAEGEQLTIDGDAVVGPLSFAPLREREFRRIAQSGEVTLELSKRGGQNLLRTLDPAFGERQVARFDHTPAYAPDPRWIVEGEFIPFDELRPTAIEATIGDITHVHPAVGEVVFELGGAEHRLLLLARDTAEAQQAGTAYTSFTDATSGLSTDPGGRSIEITHLGIRGPVTLDFNYARNIQRPYTQFAPCPVALAGNHVDVAVESGEQLPRFRKDAGLDSGDGLAGSGA